VADPRTVDQALDYLTDAYSRPPASEATRRIWRDALSEADGPALSRAVKTAAERSRWMPTIAAVLELLATGGSASGPQHVASCGRCASGLRELSVWRDDGTDPRGYSVRTGLVRCDCPAGHVVDQAPGEGNPSRRSVRVPDLTGQVRHMEADPRVLAWYLDPTPSQREGREPPSAAPGGAIARVREWLQGAAPESRQRAAQRASTVEAYRRREWQDELDERNEVPW
jgi:hypothetical protein